MKRKAKLLLSSILYYSGFFRLMRLWNNLTGKKLTILTFHAVTNNGAELSMQGLPTISISRDNFDSLLRFIRKHYKIIPMQKYMECVRGEGRLFGNSLILSFDDGYKGVMENALPVLRKYEAPAVLFIPPAAIDEGRFFWWDAVYVLLSGNSNSLLGENAHPDPNVRHYLTWMEKIGAKTLQKREQEIFDFIDALQDVDSAIRQRVLDHIVPLNQSSKNGQCQLRTVLNWQEIKQLRLFGFEIGSHTLKHQFLTSVPADEAKRELIDSKKALEDLLNQKITCFSYPGGKYTEQTVALVKEADYGCACTSDHGINSMNNDPYRLKRINISDDNLINSEGKFSSAIAAWCLFLN